MFDRGESIGWTESSHQMLVQTWATHITRDKITLPQQDTNDLKRMVFQRSVNPCLLDSTIVCETASTIKKNFDELVFEDALIQQEQHAQGEPWDVVSRSTVWQAGVNREQEAWRCMASIWLDSVSALTELRYVQGISKEVVDRHLQDLTAISKRA